MAKLICELEGVRGRKMKLYDTKVVITTEVTAGSIITGNVTDGEKTVFLKDVVGVQFKKSGALIGYLQFETPSMQMNNKSNNMFSENTFTFENTVKGVTNELMEKVYAYVVDRVEELKYGTSIIDETPTFKALPVQTPRVPAVDAKKYACPKCNGIVYHGDPCCKQCGQTFHWAAKN